MNYLNFYKLLHRVFKLLFVFFLFGGNLVFAQGTLNLYNDSSNGFGITKASTGGFVLAGSDNACCFGSYVSNDGQGFLIRTDENGEEEWRFEIPNTPDSTALISVAESSDGGFVAGGFVTQNLFLEQAYLVKVDGAGNLVWDHVLSDFITSTIYDVKPTPDNGFILAGTAWDSTFNNCGNVSCTVPLLWKVDSQGNLEWYQELDITNFNFGQGGEVEVVSDGYVLAGVVAIQPTAYFPFLMKTDFLGNPVWTETYTLPTINYHHVWEMEKMPDGGFALAAGNYNSSQTTRVVKTDASGNEEWIYSHDEPNFKHRVIGMTLTNDGGLMLTGIVAEQPFPVSQNLFLIKLDGNGNFQWSKEYENLPNQQLGNEILALDNGGFAIIGEMFMPNFELDMMLILIDSNYTIYDQLLSGSILVDGNGNCLPDLGEQQLPNRIIQLDGPQGQYFISADNQGNYEVQLDTGDYTLTVFEDHPYLEACANPQSISLEDGDTTELDFVYEVIADCPLMEVDIATTLLRFCWPNTYVVNYCNNGFATADDVYVEITLDSLMILNNVTLPYIDLGNNQISVDIGSVGPGECGNFYFNVTVNCDSSNVIGQTLCTEAYIYPDTLCVEGDSTWGGAAIVVDGVCEGDSIIYTITNMGSGDMLAPGQYIVVEDHLMGMVAPTPYQLNSGESLVLAFPAEGQTYFLSASQEPGYLWNPFPGLAIEGCGNGGGQPSLGFFAQWLENDQYPFHSIHCREVVASYDPNDKQAFPRGYGEEHYIEANTDIEYHIRFQNTGTDTAFRVVIRDTLSPFLNPGTVKSGVSSHDYKFEVFGHGIVQFTFDNIMLPDSNINEPASHGFVKFVVSQQPDNPVGSVIENTAAIYFDFNAPIYTHTPFHEIGEDFIMVSIDPEPNPSNTLLKVSPNPFNSVTIFQLENPTNQECNFELYDQSGRTIRTHTFRGDTFEFHRKELPAGLYFFRVIGEKGVIGSGKMVAY